MRKISFTREFWRDTLWFIGVLILLYVIYILIEYWPNIVEGFNRGWNSR